VPVTSADPFTVLEEGEVDLLSAMTSRGRTFPSTPLYDVWLVAVGRDVRGGDVDAHALRDRPLAVLTRDFSSRRMLEDACARARFTPQIAFEDRHVESVLAIAREGLATAIVVNEAVPRDDDTPVAALLSAGKRLGGQLALHWRDEVTLSASARRMREVILELARERAGGRAPSASRRRPRRAHRGR
jgi:LysR family cyn operon transcriptional activator